MARGSRRGQPARRRVPILWQSHLSRISTPAAGCILAGMHSFYSDKHQLHNTDAVRLEGHPFVTEEVPARAEILLAALRSAQFDSPNDAFSTLVLLWISPPSVSTAAPTANPE